MVVVIDSWGEEGSDIVGDEKLGEHYGMGEAER